MQFGPTSTWTSTEPNDSLSTHCLYLLDSHQHHSLEHTQESRGLLPCMFVVVMCVNMVHFAVCLHMGCLRHVNNYVRWPSWATQVLYKTHTSTHSSTQTDKRRHTESYLVITKQLYSITPACRGPWHCDIQGIKRWRRGLYSVTTSFQEVQGLSFGWTTTEDTESGSANHSVLWGQ